MLKNKAIRSISFLWVGSLFGAGCAFLSQVVLARTLGTSGFGMFSAALATVTLLVPLAGFGVAAYWLKVFGEEGWRARRWWSGSFLFVVVSTAFVILVLSVWAWLGPHEFSMSILLWLLLSYVLGQVALELVSSKFQLEEKYLTLAMWQFLPHLGRLMLVTVGAWWFSNTFSVYMAGLAYAVISVVVLVIGFLILLAMRRGYFSLQGHGAPSVLMASENKPSPFELVAEAWPFGAAGLFYLIYFQSAVILLAYLINSTASGIYNVAFIIMAAVYLFPSVIYQKYLLPKIHRWANSDRVKMLETFRLGNRYMLLFGSVAMILLWLGGWWLIPLLFGEEYIESVWVLNVLALAAPIRFVASSVGSVLVTKENMKRKVRYMGIVGLFNVILNIVMIPFFGVIGAAIASVASDSLLLFLYFQAVFKLGYMKRIESV